MYLELQFLVLKSPSMLSKLHSAGDGLVGCAQVYGVARDTLETQTATMLKLIQGSHPGKITDGRLDFINNNILERTAQNACKWWFGGDLNSRPHDYESCALTS